MLEKRFDRKTTPKTLWRHTKFQSEILGKNSEIRSLTTKFAMTAKNPKKLKIKMAVVTPSIRVFWGFVNQYGNVYIYIYTPIYILRCSTRPCCASGSIGVSINRVNFSPVRNLTSAQCPDPMKDLARQKLNLQQQRAGGGPVPCRRRA